MGFPFGSLTNPGNHHLFPLEQAPSLASNRLTDLTQGTNDRCKHPILPSIFQRTDMDRHDLPSLSRNTLIKPSTERGGDLEITRKVAPKIDLFFLPSSIPTLRKSRRSQPRPYPSQAVGTLGGVIAHQGFVDKSSKSKASFSK